MKRPRLFFIVATVVVIVSASPQAPRAAGVARLAPAVQSESRMQVIKHLTPSPDSVGGMPEKFEWTAVPDADSYSIGIWNEVDRMIYRQNDIKTNSLQWPKDSPLDSGTYFWSVMALTKDDRPMGDSGLAAFVVNR